MNVRFAGYAALFGRIDRGGDVVEPGAFAESLKRRGTIPLLWQHDPARPAGRVEHVAEDARGLRVIGWAEGQAGAMVAARAIDGLSFGYRVVRAEGAGPRRLIALDIVEVSLVTHPMQPKARVHAVEK